MAELTSNHIQSAPKLIDRSLTEIAKRLSGSEKVLLIGVGGGGDAISSLMLIPHLARDFGFQPKHLEVAAMLPDVLDYTGMTTVYGGTIAEITPQAKRFVSGYPISAFPEPLLSRYRSDLGVDRVIGLGMDRGSIGLAEDLESYITKERFDLVLACDVGGDFIATPENTGVLSPMMDSYALSALRSIQERSPSLNILYSIFGLGSDGESTPALLRQALERVAPPFCASMEISLAKDIERFYRQIIAPNRHSRTTDYTLRSLNGEKLDPVQFTARFHTHPSRGEVNRYYGEFTHVFDHELLPKYYLFDNLKGVSNPFELRCLNGIEWLLETSAAPIAINHELNGQSYTSLQRALGLTQNNDYSIFFGTPSFRFAGETRQRIITDILLSINTQIYNSALVFREDLAQQLDRDILATPISHNLVLIENANNRMPVECLDYLASGAKV